MVRGEGRRKGEGGRRVKRLYSIIAAGNALKTICLMLGSDFISDHITVSAGPVIANVCGSLVLLFIAAISSVGPVIA